MRFLSSPWQWGAQFNLGHILWSAQVFKCTLGENGSRYRTPEYPLEFAMQMLMMHTGTNHKQPQPVQVVNASTQKHKAEKVSRPVVKMGRSEDYLL